MNLKIISRFKDQIHFLLKLMDLLELQPLDITTIPKVTSIKRGFSPWRLYYWCRYCCCFVKCLLGQLEDFIDHHYSTNAQLNCKFTKTTILLHSRCYCCEYLLILIHSQDYEQPSKKKIDFCQNKESPKMELKKEKITTIHLKSVILCSNSMKLPRIHYRTANSTISFAKLKDLSQPLVFYSQAISTINTATTAEASMKVSLCSTSQDLLELSKVCS